MTRFLTPEGRIKIQKELIDLEGQKPPIIERLKNAKELGDLSENAEYTTAKDDLARTESRILELRNLLRNAETIISCHEGNSIKIGSKVKIEIDHKIKEYTLVGTEETDPTKGLISYQSPFGQALLEKKEGEETQIKTPRGIIKVKIIKIN